MFSVVVIVELTRKVSIIVFFGCFAEKAKSVIVLSG